MKRRIYRLVLKLILKDRDKLSLTGKQKNHIECLIQKIKENRNLSSRLEKIS